MKIYVVKHYYGEVLASSADLKTDACCAPEPPPPRIRAALAKIHPEVLSRYYGCGLIVPEKLESLSVLDLGCGAGRDAYTLAQLVGPAGRVTGVDMTPAQIEVARRHERWHADAFGFDRPNTAFLAGQIEELDRLGVAPASMDVVVSNCVVNLAPDKRAVLDQVWRALKEGGEFYFSDIYADRRLPESLQDDPILVGECLAGALYWGDFIALAKAAGFADPRLVTSRPLRIEDEAIAARIGAASFFSATYRLFKLGGLEPRCEDYGQAVRYRGDIAGAERAFALDAHHRIEPGRIFPVCGNTWRMLKDTRFAANFEFFGDFSRHYGVFPGCGESLPFAPNAEGAATACC